MTSVMKAIEFANGTPCPFTGAYLKSYDPDAYAGRGYAVWTGDINKAMRFERATDAWKLWRTQSKVKPLREDGKPNCPLTATTITIEPIEG